MAKIKICGIRRTEDIKYVNELKPDYIGFILTPGFKRSISLETARALKAELDSRIKAVGVFVDDDIETINSLVSDGIIDMVQLHGDESPQYCSKIKCPVIKCFKPLNFIKTAEYHTDYFLFDSGNGSGKAFNWSDIPKTDTPFFLAGGINVENILQALMQARPYCIDLSSAVETDGVKDYKKIKRIMECVR